MSIRSKLTVLLLALSILVLASAGIFTSISIERYLRTRIVSELTTAARQVEFHLRSRQPAVPDTGAYDRVRSYAKSGNYRLTLISSDGTVIFDSDVPEGELVNVENHAARPEIAEALRGRIGSGTRHSATIDQDLLYVARPLVPSLDPAGRFGPAAVIRLSIPLTEVEGAIREVRTNVVVVSVVVFTVVVIAVGFISRRLTRPVSDMAAVAAHIRAGELDRRITVRSDDELGRLGGAINAMIDTLREDIIRLRKLERVRTEFLGNVSHELRTPIFAIQGMLETLLDGAVDEPEVNRDFLRRALNNTRNLNALLNDLIEISRIESGEMKMSFRYFNLHELLTGVAGEMEHAAAGRDVRITPDLRHGEAEVYGDRERLRQVMVNLLDNAVKYNRHGGTIVIRTGAEQGAVRVSVEDSGIGVPPEDLTRIFERFYRVDKERSREAVGTGLGLAIVKHIVEAHGSSVTVESVPGKGSTFSFTLKTEL